MITNEDREICYALRMLRIHEFSKTRQRELIKRVPVLHNNLAKVQRILDPQDVPSWKDFVYEVVSQEYLEMAMSRHCTLVEPFWIFLLSKRFILSELCEIIPDLPAEVRLAIEERYRRYGSTNGRISEFRNFFEKKQI